MCLDYFNYGKEILTTLESDSPLSTKQLKKMTESIISAHMPEGSLFRKLFSSVQQKAGVSPYKDNNRRVIDPT